MKGKRTGIDFSKHELIITEQSGLISIHYLKRPDTTDRAVKFINTQGMTIVTGDYGNWTFNREFHPQSGESSNDDYMEEKKYYPSCQKPDKNFKRWLQYIFDAFDEICRRLKEAPETIKNIALQSQI